MHFAEELTGKYRNDRPGIPAISIPVQPTDKGLPLGIQFFANKERESSLLGFVDSL